MGGGRALGECLWGEFWGGAKYFFFRGRNSQQEKRLHEEFRELRSWPPCFHRCAQVPKLESVPKECLWAPRSECPKECFKEHFLGHFRGSTSETPKRQY